MIPFMKANGSNDTFTMDPAAIASFVKLQRGFFGWKQEMLASEAGVSLATVQRVERGVRVRPLQLRKLALGLRRPEDEFLRDRMRPTAEEFEANLVNMFAWTKGRVPVSVAPFRTEVQLRAMLAAHSLLFDSDLDASADEDIAELREWLDLASFVQAERSGIIGQRPGPDLKVRKLWRDVLDCVERIGRERHAACLTGSYSAKASDGTEPVTIAILALRSRRLDPAAANLSTVWADETVDVRQILADDFSRDSDVR